MKAIIKSGPQPGADYVTDFPEPTVADDEILIDIKATSVCGSDRSFYNWTTAAQGFNLNFPCVLGHEGSGVVIETGKAVTKFAVGDRVALDSHAPCGSCYQCRTGNGHNCNDMRLLAADINGVFAERASVPASMAFPIPDEMSFEVATLLEPAGVAWHAIQRADKQIAANVVVVSGCGPIGLLIIDFARMLGAAEVIALEPNAFRRGLAEQRGATVFAPGAEAQEYIAQQHAYRGGVDLVFEVSGFAGAYPALFDMLRRNGTFISVGHAGEPVPIRISEVINKKEITLRGIYGRLLWDTWEDLALLIRTGKLDLDWLITDRLEMGELGPVIDMLSGESNKIILYPNGVPAV
ncbi:zinc-dependent alcohol dehydrogenase [Agrococcus beijingensis]|uniref:zinc-dependent alcohol dehydrogenase n=1 Tax=Agrococcus beijingensis TaxID=3068634 RepID=UPI0027428B8B|nr:alcohol dehydrogenase catalytic domain-containing protein [Agrococcus sp. REN33]